MSELAEAAQVTPATVTGMLDHLVASGNVEREHSERDRRIVVCRLTPRGRRDVRALKAAKKARWESALADIPDEQLRAATQGPRAPSLGLRGGLEPLLYSARSIVAVRAAARVGP